MPPAAAAPVLGQKDLAAMLAAAAEFSALNLDRGPLPAVLDTGFIRIGLEHQLKKGKLPASVWGAQDGSLRLWME